MSYDIFPKNCFFPKFSEDNTFFLEKFSYKSIFLYENRNSFLSVSCIETRTRIAFFNLVIRDENEISKIISHGPAEKNEAISHENFQDQEFWLVSASVLINT